MTETKFWKSLFAVFFAAILFYLLIRVWHVLIPFLLGLTIAYLVHPLTDQFVSMGLRRDRVVIVLYITLLSVSVLLFVVFLPVLAREIRTMIQELPTYATAFDRAVEHLNDDLHIFSSRIFGKKAPSFTIPIKADRVVDIIVDKLPQNIWNFAHVGLWLLIIPFVSFFGLSHGPRWIDALFNVTPSDYVESLLGMLAQINATLGAYIRGQILDAMCVGITTMLGLWMLGVQGAIILGFVTGVFNVIPFMAPILGGGLALLFGYFQGLSWAALFGVLCLVLIVRLMDDFVFMPFIVGSVIRLHPVFMLLGVLTGYEVGGIIGLVFAIPTMAVVKIILSSVLLHKREPRLFQNQKVVI